jgi:UDP-glucose 4-epimerase
MIGQGMSDTYVITGDCGFVGSRLRQRLLSRGDDVVGIDQVAHPGEAIPHYRSMAIDLSDRKEVLRHVGLFHSARAVIHLAGRIAQSAEDSLDQQIAANLRTTENILAAMSGSEAVLVFSSTMYVFGLEPDRLPVGEDQMPCPNSSYGLTKLAAEYAVERMARKGGTRAIVLRYPGIFGLGSDVAIHLYTSKALAGEPVSVYGGGRTVRDYVHVDDVVDANLLAAQAASELGWGLYHIGSGEALTLLQIAQLATEAVGQGRVETNDRPAPFDFVFDITRAREELGYAPQSLRNRIIQYVADVRNNDSAIGR